MNISIQQITYNIAKRERQFIRIHKTIDITDLDRKDITKHKVIDELIQNRVIYSPEDMIHAIYYNTHSTKQNKWRLVIFHKRVSELASISPHI